MVLLASKIDRDQIGIAKWDQAIVYSALLLRNRQVSNEVNFPDQNFDIQWEFQFIPRTNWAGLTFNITLPHYRELSLRHLGNFHEKFYPVSAGDVEPYLGIKLNCFNGDLLQNEPAWVISLESYLSWAIKEFIKEYLPWQLRNDQSLFNIQYDDENIIFQTRFYLHLPLFYRTNSFMHSLITIREYISLIADQPLGLNTITRISNILNNWVDEETEEPPIISSIINNNSIINNSFLLVN